MTNQMHLPAQGPLRGITMTRAMRIKMIAPNSFGVHLLILLRVQHPIRAIPFPTQVRSFMEPLITTMNIKIPVVRSHSVRQPTIFPDHKPIYFILHQKKTISCGKLSATEVTIKILHRLTIRFRHQKIRHLISVRSNNWRKTISQTK